MMKKTTKKKRFGQGVDNQPRKDKDGQAGETTRNPADKAKDGLGARKPPGQAKDGQADLNPAGKAKDGLGAVNQSMVDINNTGIPEQSSAKKAEKSTTSTGTDKEESDFDSKDNAGFMRRVPKRVLSDSDSSVFFLQTKSKPCVCHVCHFFIC